MGTIFNPVREATGSLYKLHTSQIEYISYPPIAALIELTLGAQIEYFKLRFERVHNPLILLCGLSHKLLHCVWMSRVVAGIWISALMDIGKQLAFVSKYNLPFDQSCTCHILQTIPPDKSITHICLSRCFIFLTHSLYVYLSFSHLSLSHSHALTLCLFVIIHSIYTYHFIM